MSIIFVLILGFAVSKSKYFSESISKDPNGCLEWKLVGLQRDWWQCWEIQGIALISISSSSDFRQNYYKKIVFLTVVAN